MPTEVIIGGAIILGIAVLFGGFALVKRVLQGPKAEHKA